MITGKDDVHGKGEGVVHHLAHHEVITLLTFKTDIRLFQTSVPIKSCDRSGVFRASAPSSEPVEVTCRDNVQK
jgi:hypothetical protein